MVALGKLIDSFLHTYVYEEPFLDASTNCLLVRYVQRSNDPELKARILTFLQDIQWDAELGERCNREPKFGHCAETFLVAYSIIQRLKTALLS